MNPDRIVRIVRRRMRTLLSTGDGRLDGMLVSAGLEGGKSLRAKLLLDFCGKESAAAIDAACAIELLHAATLIHDDLIDHASHRRGRAALHRQCGAARSVLCGDHLFTNGLALIAGLDDPCIMRKTTQALSETLRGEIVEQSRRGDLRLSRHEYFEIIRMKSGALLGLSAELGSLLGGGDPARAGRAFAFGLRVGIGYQMVDDYRDYFAEGGGKKRFADLAEGIVTLPLIILLERCSPDEKREIVSIVGRPDHRSGTLGILRLMERYRIADEVMREIGGHLAAIRHDLAEWLDGEGAPGRRVMSWLMKRASHAEEEHRYSGRRVRGGERPAEVQAV